jgi:hypothetical protein
MCREGMVLVEEEEEGNKEASNKEASMKEDSDHPNKK